ncbi:hypothetical protein ACPPVV_00170 [Rhodanobacter sp. Col0626]|uniref:hypothetical protein n=1 Tax=Rhodanobacter sp. Col0626 TaxID=3415679 RepID=UPI003CFB156E
MKNMRYMLLAAILTSGATFAQSSAGGVGGADFVMSSARAVSPTQAAAARGLSEFAAHFAGNAGELPQGFPLDVRDLGELRNAQIGWGFQVYDVTKAALQSSASLEAIARPTGIWRYEVILHDRPIGLVTLAQASHGWEVVSVSGIGMVGDINAVVGAYGSSAGTQLRYVRVPQATADFIQVKHGAAAAQYAPLQAARDTLRVSALTTASPNGASTADTGLLDSNALRTQLRQAVARSAN